MTTMDLPESSNQSFVIKIWIEETAAEAGEAVWRGRIKHVPSGEVTYFTDLNEVLDIIERCITEMKGINTTS